MQPARPSASRRRPRVNAAALARHGDLDDDRTRPPVGSVSGAPTAVTGPWRPSSASQAAASASGRPAAAAAARTVRGSRRSAPPAPARARSRSSAPLPISFLRTLSELRSYSRPLGRDPVARRRRVHTVQREQAADEPAEQPQRAERDERRGGQDEPDRAARVEVAEVEPAPVLAARWPSRRGRVPRASPRPPRPSRAAAPASSAAAASGSGPRRSRTAAPSPPSSTICTPTSTAAQA